MDNFNIKLDISKDEITPYSERFRKKVMEYTSKEDVYKTSFHKNKLAVYSTAKEAIKQSTVDNIEKIRPFEISGPGQDGLNDAIGEVVDAYIERMLIDLTGGEDGEG